MPPPRVDAAESTAAIGLVLLEHPRQLGIRHSSVISILVAGGNGLPFAFRMFEYSYCKHC
jgi:hypothetical protein